MGACRHITLLLFAGLALCLPSAAETYTRHVPAGSRVEAQVPDSPDWDVSVSYDAETCEVFCEYRRKEQGLHLFQPPVIELRVYTDGASRPEVFTIDPAGLRVPRVAAAAVRLPEWSWLEGRRIQVAAPAYLSLASFPVTRQVVVPAADRAAASITPLRI